MFLTINKNAIFSVVLALVISFVISFCLVKVTKASSITRFNYTIVIDAGHGGRDAGASGINTQVKESDLNLVISKKLQKYLTDFGFNVVMTRTTIDGLYSETATNFKKDDMAKREKIINDASADMVISIHQNSYAGISERGAQAFFEPTNEESINLSNAIQHQLINNLPSARDSANKGDYFILKTKLIPVSLVECGFLTNPEEEALLITDEYQQKVAYAIFCGILEYYGIENTK